MTEAEYYTAPPQEMFEDIKQAAIALWKTYDDTYGYATKKVNRIKDIENVKDNAWYIVAMFDIHNQSRLVNQVAHEETAEKIREVVNWSAREMGLGDIV